MNEPATLLPDPYFRFQFPPRPDGEQCPPIALDPIEALLKIDDIKEVRQESRHFEWVADFRTWLAEKGFPVSMIEAEALWQEVQVRRVRDQKVFLEALQSPNFTDSRPVG